VFTLSGIINAYFIAFKGDTKKEKLIIV